MNNVRHAVAVGLLALSAVAAAPRVRAQETVEQTLSQLTSKDAAVRLKAVRAVKGLADPAAAVPLAATVVDRENEIQLEAIAAELNIFLADRVTPTRRVGLIVEMRGRIAAEPIFSAGPAALGPRRVPLAVATALITASRDNDPRVALEAMYAFGSLGPEVAAADRAVVLSHAAPVFAGATGLPDPGLRIAALRVAGVMFAPRAGDGALPESIGDAAVAALNDREDPVRETAMWALGAMKNQRSVRALTELFRHYRKGPLAEGSFDALAHIGHPGSLPDFVEQLSSKNATLKVIAIEGLARSGDRSRAEAVHAAIASERGEAMLLAGHFANVLLAAGPPSAIVEAVARQRLQRQAKGYLRELANGRVAALAPSLQNPDPVIRLAVVEALGASGDPAAVAPVRAATGDGDPAVSRAATRALAVLGSAQ